MGMSPALVPAVTDVGREMSVLLVQVVYWLLTVCSSVKVKVNVGGVGDGVEELAKGIVVQRPEDARLLEVQHELGLWWKRVSGSSAPIGVFLSHVLTSRSLSTNGIRDGKLQERRIHTVVVAV